MSIGQVLNVRRIVALASLGGLLRRGRKRERLAEKALRESEQQYRLLFAANPNPMFVFDEETLRFLAVNDVAVRHYGWSSSEFLAMTVLDVRPPEDRALARGFIQRHRGAREAGIGTIRHCRKDGTVMEVEITVSSIPFAGRPGRLCSMNDVTERKRVEEALRLSEKHFRALAESLPQIVWTADAEGGIEWFNRRWYDYTGKPQRVGEGWSWDQVAHPDDMVHTLKHWQQARKEGVLFENEIRLRRHDGQYRWFLIRAWPLRGAEGNVTRWFGTNTDVHDMKAAEAALRLSREDLDRAQEVGQIGSWRLDVRRDVLTWSDENHRIFGVPKGTPLTYETFVGLVHPDDRQNVDTQWQAGLRGEPYDIEHRIVVGGQVKWVREKAYLEFDDAGVLLGGFGITQDITERKQGEKALRDSEERLRASLGEKEALLKEIHHRVKNNMQVISSLVALQADGLKDGAIRAVLQDVTHRVRSMALVHEKLYQSSDLARVEFAEYARSLLNYLWRAYGTAAIGIRLTLDLEPVSLPVNEAVPCGLILNELVSNALKHAFRDRGHAEAVVTVSLRGDGEGQVRLAVRDNGTGLPAGFDWSQAGSLGLRLVHMLAKQLDAAVEVSSTGGTKFEISFERAEEGR